MDCPDTRAPWGGVCATCGETLPTAKPLGGWRASKIDAGLSERARASSVPGTPFRRQFSPNGQTASKPSHLTLRAPMTEAQVQADRERSRRYYEGHREQVLQRRREAHAAKA